MSTSYPLTELQLAILDVLWRRGEASVLDIHDELREGRRVAQSTISTLLARLGERGYVAYREEGRKHVYRATVEPEALRKRMTAGFLEHTRPLFRSDLGLLVSHLLAEGDVSPEDLDEARSILARMEEELREEEP
ncbi:MAG: BlaI/MecI/CopY family transcriptional regulator [Gemmatimonadota bacterium]